LENLEISSNYILLYLLRSILKSKGIYRITLIYNFMATEPGLLKASILKSLSGTKEKNSREIFDFIRKVPYSYKSAVVNYRDVLYTGTIEALRVELVYLRKHGFITKTNKTRLLNYALTKLGKQAVESPFRFVDIFEERVSAEVEKRMSGTNLPDVIEKPIVIGTPDRNEKIEMGSILYLGINNEVGLNVSGDPTKGKFITLKVTDGEVTLS